MSNLKKNEYRAIEESKTVRDLIKAIFDLIKNKGR